MDGKGSDSWEEMGNDEVFKSDFCYSVAITADIPSGYVLSQDVTGSVNDKSHGTNYSRIDYNKENGKFYIRVDFDPALVAIEGIGKYDTLTLNGFAFVTEQPVALTIVGMENTETFTIKETSGALEPDPEGGLRITGGSLIAGASVGISTNSKLTIDGGVLLATGTQSGYAIKADGDILLRNTTLVDSLERYKISPSSNGVHTDGTLNIENAYMQAGKITTATGIYALECIQVINLNAYDTIGSLKDSAKDPVAKDISVKDDTRSNYFVIDGRWRV